MFEQPTRLFKKQKNSHHIWGALYKGKPKPNQLSSRAHLFKTDPGRDPFLKYSYASLTNQPTPFHVAVSDFQTTPSPLLATKVPLLHTATRRRETFGPWRCRAPGAESGSSWSSHIHSPSAICWGLHESQSPKYKKDTRGLPSSQISSTQVAVQQ